MKSGEGLRCIFFCSKWFEPRPEIKVKAYDQSNYQPPQSNFICQGLIDLQFGQARKEKTQVGVRKISISKFPEDV